MTAAYVLTTRAEADLRDIIRYTRMQWGNAQTRRYVAKLTRAIERIAGGDGPFKDMTALYPALRMSRCEHHYSSACRATVRRRSSWRSSMNAWT